MELTIANPYKGRLETINVEFSDKNTTYFTVEEKNVSITDYEDCLIINNGTGSYSTIIYGASRTDINDDIHMALRLSEEKMDQWGNCDPPEKWQIEQ